MKRGAIDLEQPRVALADGRRDAAVERQCDHHRRRKLVERDVVARVIEGDTRER